MLIIIKTLNFYNVVREEYIAFTNFKITYEYAKRNYYLMYFYIHNTFKCRLFF